MEHAVIRLKAGEKNAFLRTDLRLFCRRHPQWGAGRRGKLPQSAAWRRMWA